VPVLKVSTPFTMLNCTKAAVPEIEVLELHRDATVTDRGGGLLDVEYKGDDVREVGGAVHAEEGDKDKLDDDQIEDVEDDVDDEMDGDEEGSDNALLPAERIVDETVLEGAVPDDDDVIAVMQGLLITTMRLLPPSAMKMNSPCRARPPGYPNTVVLPVSENNSAPGLAALMLAKITTRLLF
jgi:hypothetical protein